MCRTGVIGTVALSALLTGASAPAQQATPTTYTFVGEWQVPRAQWATFVADFDKNTRPVLEKLASAGTLVGWGVYEAIVHTEKGPTHGVWWSSNSIAGIERARGELVKGSAASSSLASATAHRDYYLRTLLGNGKSASGTDGYLSVSSYVVKPGQGQEWRQLWEKYSKPTLEDLVSKGVVMGYSVDVEDTHTETPGLRFVAVLSPNVDAEDKIADAYDAASSKLGADEQKQMNAAFAAVLEPGAHRDLYAKVIRYWSK